jgi:HD-GYP domain-containing protein (c-di-GMP phosphodiesterase class II)
VSTVLALPLPLPAAEPDPRVAAERKVKRNLIATVQALAATIELRDPYTAMHQRRVADLAVGMGRLLGLSSSQLCGLDLAATIHDIGKLGVPVEILSKPGRISTIEYELIKGHAAAGAEVVAGIEFPWPIRDIIWQHHERLDGSGYPRRLRGDEIMLEARILAVADVTEAMTAHRPYRKALGIDAALTEIEASRGTRYDADAVDACTKLFRELGHRLPE